jgi:hypothetical protein
VDKVNIIEDIQHVCITLDIPGSQYLDLVYYLNHGTAPSLFGLKKKRALRIKSIQYQLINNVLFRKSYDSILLRCLEKQEVDKVLFELHDGPAGGHLEVIQLHINFYVQVIISQCYLRILMHMFESVKVVKLQLDEKRNHHYLCNQSLLNTHLNNGDLILLVKFFLVPPSNIGIFLRPPIILESGWKPFL